MSDTKPKKPKGLTSEQMSRATAHLQKVWAQDKFGCPICKTNDWLIDGVFELREFSYGSLNLVGALFPVVVVACKNCGYTFMLNAVKAGIVEPEK